MNPERWERIKRLFDSALEQESHRRMEFLHEACAGDEPLRVEVVSMLERHAESPDFPEWPTLDADQDAPADSVDFQIPITGTTLGHYRITGKLGEGGMGSVYRGRDDQLRRDVAIKVLRKGQPGDSVGNARLLREARAAASLNHPNICTIYEVGEDGGQVYISMELIAGHALSERLEQAPLSHEEVLHYGVQVADALAHAHEHGIVHHDLKSANVIVTPEGRCKVLDFGLAKRLENVGTQDETKETALTETGAMAGTPAYMPPEKLRGQATDERGDVWALGVMLYEAEAGVKPFKGNTPFELVSSILDRDPPPLSGKVPVALKNVIERCLEKDPEKRYRQGREVRAALEAVRAGEISKLAALLNSRRRSRFMQCIAAALAAAALIVALVVFSPFEVRDKLASLFATGRIESVAVLPLTNLSGEPAQESMADGMTDALITDLAKFRGLKRVIGFRSVMRYKNTKLKLTEVARELNVESLITGAVDRSEDRISVTIQLIDPATGVQLWADLYERGLKDRLTLRNEVLRAVTEQLRVRLTPDEKARLAQIRKSIPEAENAYQQGMFYWYRHTVGDIERADRYFQLALEKDPNFIDAYIGKAWVLVYYGSAMMDARDVLSEIRKIEQKILDLDPEHPLGRQGDPDVKFYYEWDWTGAERGYKSWIDFRPNSADSYAFYWEFLSSMKRIKEAGEIIERCLELDPFNALYLDSKGKYLIYAHRFDEAIRFFGKFIEDGYDFGAGPLRLWTAYHHKGKYHEAFEQARGSFSGMPEIQQALDQSYKEAGYTGAMRRMADLMANSPDPHKLSPNIARLYAYAGDKESALAWLEKAFDEHDSGLVQIQIDPDWDVLRSDPRFQRLVGRMKFPQ